MTLARWPYLVFDLLNATWFICGTACLALSAAFVLRKDAVGRSNELLARLEGDGGRLLSAGLYFPLVLALGNLARFQIYYLTSMSGVTANLAWNVAHGYGLRTMVYGDHSYLASHFAFASGLFSPMLWIWNSAGVLAAAHGLLLGAVPLALFALARRLTRARLVPWLILLLSLAHPSFQELTGTVLEDSVYAVPFFIAAAYFLETDRVPLGLLFGALMFSAREQVPFITFGVGLYLLFRRAAPDRRRLGLVVMAASSAIWLLEMRTIARAQENFACPWVCNTSLWDYFKDLGGSPRGVLLHVLTRPWDFAAALVLPADKLPPVLRIMSHAAFLPLFGGAAFLPALFVWLPNQLATAGTPYQGLRAYYSSFVLGPLLWAMIHGLIRVHDRCAADRRRLLAAVSLAVAGWGFFSAPSFYSPEVRVIPRAWEAAVPKALALIPSDAAVWCDAYLLPHLSMRRYVKILPSGRDCAFETNLFLPDYVLMSAYWMKTSAPYSENLLRLLRDRGFELRFREADLLLWVNPKASAPGAGPERLILPPERADKYMIGHG